MIINIEGKNSPFSVQRIVLEPFCRYSIRLIALQARINSYVPAGIYKVCTNLIERENGNLDRILGYAHLDRKAHMINFTPTQPIWYKLRLVDISMIDIHLQAIATDQKLDLSELACQFEIIKDERI